MLEKVIVARGSAANQYLDWVNPRAIRVTHRSSGRTFGHDVEAWRKGDVAPCRERVATRPPFRRNASPNLDHAILARQTA